MSVATDVINILIVDDSMFVRRVISGFFKNDDRIKVIDQAKDGKDAWEKVKKTKFDLVLCDFEMPVMNGEDFLLAVKNDASITEKPPVIVFSSVTSKGSKATVACLLAGARDYIQKPSQELDDLGEGTSVRDLLRQKIISIVENERSKKAKILTQEQKQGPRKQVNLRNPGLVVIGCSTGGPAALEKVLLSIPANFRFPVLVVQHMPEHFTKIMAESLDKKVALNVVEVTEPTLMEKGKVYIAGGAEHMVLDEKGMLQMGGKQPRNFCVPSVDVLFESVAKNYNKSVLSVMLTGMGSDGKDGVKAMKDSIDCFSIVQDQQSSVVWAMPKAVYEAGCSDLMLHVDEIGRTIANV